jgi:hypothetical protein
MDGDQKQMRWQPALSLVVVLLSVVLGCGKSGIPIVPVNGTITFAGGPPPKPGTIMFVPTSVAEGLPRRPATAVFDVDGDFKVTSFTKDDGLIPGTYHARIDCWMKEPTLNNPITFETYNYVPKNFEPPPITVDANADEVVINFDVPKKKT